MRMQGTRIDLVNLNKFYGQVKVVDDVSASIAPGEFVSFLGPSGSGKTTTLSMVAGFVSASSGQILVDGNDVASTPPQKRGFGMVFQNYSLFPHLNVFENIAFPLRLRGFDRSTIEHKVKQSLQLVQLGQFGQRKISQLSGGQQQRVAMARAVVYEPKLVLMDEPMGALDKNLRFTMQTEIKEIQRQLGMTVLYVTHDQEEAMNMSDRIVIMKDGRIEQIGAPAEVYNAPISDFVAQFLGEANLFNAVVAERRSDSTILRLTDGTSIKVAGVVKSGSVGSKISVFVRPENIKITPRSHAGEDANIVLGEVTRCSFLGNFRRYSIRMSSGDHASVDQTNSGHFAAFEVGSQVQLSWGSQECQVLEVRA